MNKEKKNVFHFAASSYKDCVDLVQLLFQLSQANLLFTQADESMKLPIHYAAQFGNVRIIKLLLQNTGNKQINAVDSEGNTPLHICAHFASWAFQVNKSVEDYAEIVKELIRLGADTLIQNKVGQTALDLARNSDRDIGIIVEALSLSLKEKASLYL